MGWFNRKPKAAELGKMEFLNQYTMGQGDLRVVGEVPSAGEPMPDAWRELPNLAPADRVSLAVALLRASLGTELRNTISYVSEFARDVELMMLGENYLLMYTILNRLGGTVYYAGGNPYQRQYPPTDPAPEERGILPYWGRVPVPLRTFYEQTHDGFYYFPSRSMGLNPVWEVRCLGDYDLGSMAGYAGRLAEAYTFFSASENHVLVDLANPDPNGGVLWLQDAEPDFGINFWDVVDEWTVIGFEN